MKRKLLVFLVLLAFVSHTFSVAKEVLFFDSGNLSSNLITDIAQDKDGFIWIATEYGLNRFDGERFVRYIHDRADSVSLKSNQVRRLYIDGEGVLWVGTSRGLQYYVPEKAAFRTVPFEKDKGYDAIRIFELNGDLCIRSSGRGFYRVDRERMRLEQMPQISQACGNAPIESVFQDSERRIWACTRQDGLYRFDKDWGQMRRYACPEIPSDKTFSMVSDGGNRLFVFTRMGVARYDETRDIFVPVPFQGGGMYDIRDMVSGPDGRVYVATFGNGVHVVDTEKDMVVPLNLRSSELNMDEAKSVSLFWDRDGDLWVGCFQEGLALYSAEPPVFQSWTYPEEGRNFHNPASVVMQDRKGNVWVGIDKKGVVCLDRQKKIVGQWLSGQTVISLREEPDGSVWAGTYYQNLFCIDPETKGLRKVLHTAGRIKSITGDGQGNLYLGCLGAGVKKYNKATGKVEDVANRNPDHPVRLKNRFVNVVRFDSKGMLWIGHYKGVDCYDVKNGCYMEVPEDSVLDSSVCYALAEDYSGRMLFGTNEGLYIWDGSSLKHYSTKEGLSSDVVCGLGKDREGNVWCSTFGGLNQVKPDGTIVGYYSGNGLNDREFVRGVYCNGDGGTLYFGNNSGLTYFSPEAVAHISFLKKPVLTGLFAGNRSLPFSSSSGRLELSYRDKMLALEFSTLDYRHAKSIYYEYRLAELGEDWGTTLPGYSRVMLNGLSWGTYRFEVRACLDGAYSPASSWTLHIAPPWYCAWWAYALYVLVALAVGFRVYRSLQRKRVNRQNAEKLHLFINLAHDIRSPMTLILNPVTRLLDETSDGQTRKALRAVYKNACRIMGLVEQMLDISKIDKGLLRLKYAETDMVAFISELCQTFDYQAEERRITLRFEHGMKSLPVWFDPGNFDKVLMNLLSNAFKYTPDGGEITVSLEALPANGNDEGWAEIRVADTGPGLKEKELGKVFERFYQSKGALFGYGIGLNLTKLLVELHKGTIEAANRNDRSGCCFTVRIPLGEAHVDSVYVEENEEWKRPVSLFDKEERTASHKAVRRRTGYRILVVDDDKELCRFLSAELADTYKVLTAFDGEQGMKTALKELPDLIVSDLKMPGMDGFELVKSLKKNNNTNHIPVILLTTQSEREEFMRSLEVKADAFVAKPFVVEELRLRITNLLANRALLKGKFSGSQDQEGKLKEIEVKSGNEELMNKVMNLVNEHLSDPDFNVEFLAEHVGMSRVQLHRKMKEITGISTGEFIRNMRMKQAAKLLEDGELNVSQVAYMVGFVNHTHFSIVFKKFYGMTPTEYIQRKKG